MSFGYTDASRGEANGSGGDISLTDRRNTLYFFIYFFPPPGREPRLKRQPVLIMLKQMVQSIAGTCFRELLLSCLSPRGRPAITSCASRLIFIDTRARTDTHIFKVNYNNSLKPEQ